MSVARTFDREVAENIARQRADGTLVELSRRWIEATTPSKYTYNFTWLGRPIIQFPQDILAVQELIWNVRPDLIVETGVAHGGSLVLSASCLELLGSDGRVIGIDIEIRPHNRAAIEAHPLAHRIDLLEGSSTDPAIAAAVADRARGRRVMVFLDSNHTHAHVAEELRLYAPLVGAGSYVVVFDTIIEFMPPGSFPDRPWDVGDNPYTAVQEFLTRSDRFAVDADMEAKLLITVAPGGYLRCLADPPRQV
ncbi:MAG: cephalosporin hydroxylase [Phycisphaerales bacterium]|nr:cephalosporin hydroxylase [Phycisphaerales bacterium]